MCWIGCRTSITGIRALWIYCKSLFHLINIVDDSIFYKESNDFKWGTCLIVIRITHANNVNLNILVSFSGVRLQLLSKCLINEYYLSGRVINVRSIEFCTISVINGVDWHFHFVCDHNLWRISYENSTTFWNIMLDLHVDCVDGLKTCTCNCWV